MTRHEKQFDLETLEQRILLSADPALGALDSSSAPSVSDTRTLDIGGFSVARFAWKYGQNSQPILKHNAWVCSGINCLKFIESGT